MIGYQFKLGAKYYKIFGIENLRHKEATGSVDSLDDTTVNFDTYMKPLDGYAYFVEFLAIDGYLGWQLEFPAGMPHGTPRGNIEYIYFDEANVLNMMYVPFIITPPNYPSFKLYNPESFANNSDMIFKGKRWLVKQLVGDDIPQPGQFVTMQDYAKGIGQG